MYKKAIKKHIKDLANYEHATDIGQGSWNGRHVLINSLCVGDVQEQRKTVEQAELSEAKSVIMLQCVEDGEKILQPWTERGYNVEKLPVEMERGHPRAPPRRAGVAPRPLPGEQQHTVVSPHRVPYGRPFRHFLVILTAELSSHVSNGPI